MSLTPEDREIWRRIKPRLYRRDIPLTKGAIALLRELARSKGIPAISLYRQMLKRPFARYTAAGRQDADNAIAGLLDYWSVGRRYAAEMLRRRHTPLEWTLVRLWPAPNASAWAWRVLRGQLLALDVLEHNQGLTGGCAPEDLGLLCLVALARQIGCEEARLTRDDYPEEAAV